MNIQLNKKELEALMFSLQSLSYDEEANLNESVTSVSALFNKLYSEWEKPSEPHYYTTSYGYEVK